MERYAMVGLEIIDLLAKHNHPQVFTDELDHIQRLHHPRPVP